MEEEKELAVVVMMVVVGSIDGPLLDQHYLTNGHASERATMNQQCSWSHEAS